VINKDIIAQLMYRMYGVKNRRLRKLIERVVLKLENGQTQPTAIRRIYADYAESKSVCIVMVAVLSQMR